MAINTNPAFIMAPRVEWGTITTANTAKDGTGTVVTVFTGEATDGSLLRSVIFRPLGTNTATVARIFLNNGSTNATATNNTLIGEITLAATTLSEVSATPHYEWSANNIWVPAGYKINITIGTTVAAGYAVTGVGGDF